MQDDSSGGMKDDVNTIAQPALSATSTAPVPLVLLPGTLCDGRLFAPLLSRLDERLIATPSIDGDDPVAVARRLLARLPAHFALLGFSLGGLVALEMALMAPDRVVGLALVNSNARARAVDAPPHPGPPSAAIAAVAPRAFGSARGGDDGLRVLLEDMASTFDAPTHAAQEKLAATRTDKRSLLAQLAMPALVLGGVQDVLCPPTLQHELAEGLPDAALVLLDGVGHFAPLESPDDVAVHVATWLARVDHAAAAANLPTSTCRTGDEMTKAATHDQSSQPSTTDESQQNAAVLQVERRDFTELVPTDRERVQGMRGFDPIYTDIVDYIVRCTHRIWDERDVGLIYTHYTHNCVAYTTMGTMYDRETHIRDTIQRLVEFPDRRGLAQQVIWRGNDRDGFYTSHMTHGQGRHSQFGMYGKPTGRTFLTRTVADCMILENKIYKEWIVRDNMGPVIQLGLDPHAYAQDIAVRKFEAGEPIMEVVENRRLLGQYPPETDADTSIAHSEGEAQLLRDLHHIYNKRMFGRIHELYAPNCQWHGPLMREYYGVAAVLQQTMRLVALIPDGFYVPQHICSVESEEGGTKYAVRWTLDGHHLGYGPLGAPTGHPLFVMGVSHYHVRDGKIIDEWSVYDELSMLAQIKLAALQRAAG
ncbi:alpha/beta fold hydrolase [Sphingomonas sp. RHCKR7]|uniref:alpha/beta fold hydrolase n=1 Tax=Sphingomonas folli TaxID=2862497 RepID=UPI001CA5D9D4|nr:alpha/beta fold hydrolase [Sphingomonas folli]MBW6526562.1 alpha/beta fold hydrolase [Sphingomonas folli]